MHFNQILSLFNDLKPLDSILLKQIVMILFSGFSLRQLHIWLHHLFIKLINKIKASQAVQKDLALVGVEDGAAVSVDGLGRELQFFNLLVYGLEFHPRFMLVNFRLPGRNY